MGWPWGWSACEPLTFTPQESIKVMIRDREEGREAQEVPMVRSGNDSAPIRGSAGGLVRVSAEEVLQPNVCQQPEAPDALGNISLEGAKAHEGQLRGLRGQDESSGTPCGPGAREQQPGECADPVQALPRLLALDRKAAWEDGGWENGIPRVATGVKNRVDRLRMLGNGWVPQCAVTAFRLLEQARQEVLP